MDMKKSLVLALALRLESLFTSLEIGFSSWRNVDSDSADVRSAGKLFQIRGPTTAKACRSATVDRLIRMWYESVKRINSNSVLYCSSCCLKWSNVDQNECVDGWSSCKVNLYWDSNISAILINVKPASTVGYLGGALQQLLVMGQLFVQLDEWRHISVTWRQLVLQLLLCLQ